MSQIIFEDKHGDQYGADPRTLTPEQLNAAGHTDLPLGKVIRLKCLDCCAGVADEVRRCTAVSCVLWPYRMRKNPFRKKEMTDEQRAAASERFRLIRERNAADDEDDDE